MRQSVSTLALFYSKCLFVPRNVCSYWLSNSRRAFPSLTSLCKNPNSAAVISSLARRSLPEFGSVDFGVRKRRVASFSRMSTGAANDEDFSFPWAEEAFMFGPYKISPKEVFLVTKHCYALVNLRPVVPGHILHELIHLEHLEVVYFGEIVVPRFTDLNTEEVTDLWLTAQRVGQKLEPFFNGTSLTLSIQDGAEAGQTVPHVHVHILPRKQKDFQNNDEIYDAIDKKEAELGHLNLDKERKDRNPEEMFEEAAMLRKLF